MKRPPADSAPAVCSAAAMECPTCGARMLVVPGEQNPYPIKLPGICPCCLKPILRYRPDGGSARFEATA